MKVRLLKDFLGWGFLLWLFGYILGIVFFFILPQATIGWFIMPIGVVITLWVLLKKIKSKSLNHYIILAFLWTLIAIVLDYMFLVKLLEPKDKYYKLDVYLYYGLTFFMPLIIGLWEKHKSRR